MKIEHQQLIIPITEESDIDTILTAFHISRKQRYLYYVQHKIQVNHHVVTQSCCLHTHDILSIQLAQEKDDIASWNKQIDILYEDELFLLVNKPSGVLVHSDGTNTHHTLCNIVKAYYDQSDQACLVRPIHRLDVDTSGIVMFCKLPFFQPLLDHMLSEKRIERQYLAFAEGTFLKKEYPIEKSIARDRHNAKKMRVDPHGKEAKTKVIVVKQFKRYAMLQCQLSTGRTHQIRVHLQSIQHPLLGDALYGRNSSLISRCALHAYHMRFYHPILQKTIEITCELPADMAALQR